jgi:hypothetical protein
MLCYASLFLGTKHLQRKRHRIKTSSKAVGFPSIFAGGSIWGYPLVQIWN